MRFVKVVNGVVDVVALSPPADWLDADGYVVVPEGWQEAPHHVFAGFLRDGEKWVPPPEPTPEEILAAERAGMVVSRFQAKAALLQAGLLDQVNAALTEADPVAQLAWAEAVEFRRTSPTILGLAATIGLTDEQLDDLFRAAAQLEA
jgi:hypothetical protein